MRLAVRGFHTIEPPYKDRIEGLHTIEPSRWGQECEDFIPYHTSHGDRSGRTYVEIGVRGFRAIYNLKHLLIRTGLPGG